MIKKIHLFSFVVLLSLIINFVWAQGDISLTTYYPAPFGVYRRLDTEIGRLVPFDDVPAAIVASPEEGMFYFDKGTINPDHQGLRYYDGSDWVQVGYTGARGYPEFISPSQFYDSTGNTGGWVTYNIPAGVFPAGVQARLVILEAEMVVPVLPAGDPRAEINIRAWNGRPAFNLLTIRGWDQAGGSPLAGSGQGVFPLDYPNQRFQFSIDSQNLNTCQIRIIGYFE